MFIGHRQIEWDDELLHDLRAVVRLAIREDFDRTFDVTSLALVPRGAVGAAQVVAREPGTLAGISSVGVVIDEMAIPLRWTPLCTDGCPLSTGDVLGQLVGSARDLLAAERILLNTLGHLSGIATMTRRFVDQVVGTRALICDTRKTLPGWRRLEKYAVRCGGGTNHRLGLYDAILIKDNHLAFGAAQAGDPFGVADAIRRARSFAKAEAAELTVQVEVDSLEQLADALAGHPDMVLLDNMDLEQLRHAVAMRDRQASEVVLEASGGVRLDTVAAIAASGVDRISIGAITHSAPQLDIGMDWTSNLESA